MNLARVLVPPTSSDFAYAIGMALACVVSYWIMTHLLTRIVGRDDELLGGMWAAIAAAFVFRDSRSAALAASAGRLVATATSCVLCLALMSFMQPSALGMALVLAVGSIFLIAMNLRSAIVTMAITTIVVMVVAILNPPDGKVQPLLRFIDTAVGIAVGLTCQFGRFVCTGACRLLTGKASTS